jgi:hypothetical protein
MGDIVAATKPDFPSTTLAWDGQGIISACSTRAFSSGFHLLGERSAPKPGGGPMSIQITIAAIRPCNVIATPDYSFLGQY